MTTKSTGVIPPIVLPAEAICTRCTHALGNHKQSRSGGVTTPPVVGRCNWRKKHPDGHLEVCSCPHYESRM